MLRLRIVSILTALVLVLGSAGTALALEVFHERGLITMTVQEDRVTLCLNPIQGKVDLNACPYLSRLRDDPVERR